MFDYMGDEIICKAIEKALVCPSCNSFLVERQNYCTKCGQVLDWKEIKGDY